MVPWSKRALKRAYTVCSSCSWGWFWDDQLRDTGKTCWNCGAVIEQKSEQKTPRPRKPADPNSKSSKKKAALAPKERERMEESARRAAARHLRAQEMRARHLASTPVPMWQAPMSMRLDLDDSQCEHELEEDFSQSPQFDNWQEQPEAQPPEMDLAEPPVPCETHQCTPSVVTQQTWEADQLWHALYHPLCDHSSPSRFVESSAAFRYDPEGAEWLGRSFEQWMTSVETFFCTAYTIPCGSRYKYCGRASAREPRLCSFRPRACTSPQLANPVAQWWRTLATHLDLLCKLVVRQRTSGMIEALLRKCCTMGSQFPDDPATLVITPEDRANWISTLSVLSRATPQQLGQISDAAEKNAQSAARAMGRASVAAFNAWVALMAHQSPGSLHKHVKPKDPVTSEMLTRGGPTKQPFEIIDAKAQRWAHTWKHGAEQNDIIDALCAARAEAFWTELPRIPVSQIVSITRRMSDRTGRGFDNVGPADIRALPRSALSALRDLYLDIERRCQWPWQLMVNLVALKPKPTSGDRGIALVPWLIRLWTQLRDALPVFGPASMLDSGTRPLQAPVLSR